MPGYILIKIVEVNNPQKHTLLQNNIAIKRYHFMCALAAGPEQQFKTITPTPGDNSLDVPGKHKITVFENKMTDYIIWKPIWNLKKEHILCINV